MCEHSEEDPLEQEFYEQGIATEVVTIIRRPDGEIELDSIGVDEDGTIAMMLRALVFQCMAEIGMFDDEDEEEEVDGDSD